MSFVSVTYAATAIYGTRKALLEKNLGNNNDTVFSHTTVSSGIGSTVSSSTKGEETDISLASLGPYQEFAVSTFQIYSILKEL